MEMRVVISHIKRSKCSQPLSYLSSPSPGFLVSTRDLSPSWAAGALPIEPSLKTLILLLKEMGSG